MDRLTEKIKCEIFVDNKTIRYRKKGQNPLSIDDIDYLNKLGELEDLEEDLGIDLVTLYKAIKQQKVWTKYENEIDCCESIEYYMGETFIYFYWENGKHLVFELKDYGKTWALTKEELL